MPNWCSNDLSLEGDKDKILAAMKDIHPIDDGGSVDENVVEFNLAVPMPAELVDTVSPARGDDATRKRLRAMHGADNWYDWSVNNWSTKWTGLECFVGWQGDNYYSIEFESAWAPPENWLKKLAPKHPDVKFSLTYDEPGLCFDGELTMQGDEVLVEYCRETSPEVCNED